MANRRRGVWALGLLVACVETPPEKDKVPVDPAEVWTADQRYLLELEPSQRPYVAGDDVALVVVVSDGDAVVEDATVRVRPWMPEHGHGVSGEPTVETVEPGTIEARWTFPMPGRWELTLKVDGVDGKDSAVVAYEVDWRPRLARGTAHGVGRCVLCGLHESLADAPGGV